MHYVRIPISFHMVIRRADRNMSLNITFLNGYSFVSLVSSFPLDCSLLVTTMLAIPRDKAFPQLWYPLKRHQELLVPLLFPKVY